jgi:2-isopropylmalate synthase
MQRVPLHNGGTMPWTVEAVTAEVVAALAAEDASCGVGVHMHNDTAVAVANSLAGVRGGANMVQGCVNGYGERTGNAVGLYKLNAVDP